LAKITVCFSAAVNNNT